MAFLVGIVIGLLSSLPPSGPVSVLVLRHFLAGNASRVRWVGWGRVLPESIAAFLGCVGITAAQVYAPWVSDALSWIGAVILCGLAIWFITGRAAPNLSQETELATSRDFMTGLTLSGMNPTLLVTWPVAVSMLAKPGLIDPTTDYFLLSGGVGLGIFSSYLAIGFLAGKVHGKVSERFALRTVQIVGLFLLALVAVFLWKAFQ